MSIAAREIPITFECGEARLLGMVHLPAHNASRRGILFVVPGGPQIRTGVCRNLVLSSRRLAERGITSMRFEQRGVGDSGGAYAGFDHWEQDVRSACDAFLEHAPHVEEVVLWGECNAASATMISAWREPRVRAIILQNPWVRSTETQAKAIIKTYYRDRIRQKSFWVKVLTLRFMPWKSLQSFLRLRASASAVQSSVLAREYDEWDDSLPFQARMLEGMKRFKGPVLVLFSSKARTREEMLEVIDVSPGWKQQFRSERLREILIEGGVHRFDSRGFRESLVEHCVSWLSDLDDHDSVSHPATSAGRRRRHDPEPAGG